MVVSPAGVVKHVLEAPNTFVGGPAVVRAIAGESGYEQVLGGLVISLGTGASHNAWSHLADMTMSDDDGRSGRVLTFTGTYEFPASPTLPTLLSLGGGVLGTRARGVIDSSAWATVRQYDTLTVTWTLTVSYNDNTVGEVDSTMLSSVMDGAMSLGTDHFNVSAVGVATALATLFNDGGTDWAKGRLTLFYPTNTGAVDATQASLNLVRVGAVQTVDVVRTVNTLAWTFSIPVSGRSGQQSWIFWLMECSDAVTGAYQKVGSGAYTVPAEIPTATAQNVTARIAM